MKTNGIKLEAIEGVQTVVFQSPYNPEHKLICIREDTPREKMWDMIKDMVNTKRCDYAEFDGYGSRFFLCYVADCFDPPMAVVRADDVNEAVDIFVDKFEYAQEDQTNYGTPEEFEKAFESGQVGITDSGWYYDNEQMRCIQLTGPVQITMEV